MNCTFLDLENGVGDTIQFSADSLQLGQPLLQSISRPLTVSHLHQERALEPSDIPVHGVQTVTTVLDVLRHLQLDLVQLRDDLVLCISCQVSKEERQLHVRCSNE